MANVKGKFHHRTDHKVDAQLHCFLNYTLDEVGG